MGNQGQGGGGGGGGGSTNTGSGGGGQDAEITKGDVAITEDETTNKKYLLISVPEFDDDPSGNPTGGDKYGEPMTSYLRLGVPKDSDIGDELIDHAYAVGAVGFTGSVKLPGEKDPVSVAFVDDERNRGGVTPTGEIVEPYIADGHHMSVAQRYNLHTKHLKSKGGWRDHSDGNRISTTYGDKVEVIRGNYKLVVMGRQDDPGNSQGHEWCGNHVQDWGQGTMPGASTTLEWIQNGYTPRIGNPNVRSDKVGTLTLGTIVTSPAKPAVPASPGVEAKDKVDEEIYRGGVWLLINSTERVYQYSRNAGNFRTQQWGEMLESFVGSENPEHIGTTAVAGYQGHPTKADHESCHTVYKADSAVPTEEPEKQRTISAELADRLSPDSRGLPRGNPHIVGKTWAQRIDNYTGTSGWKIPKIYEETWATDKEGHTHIGTETSTENIDIKTETSTIGVQTSTTTVGTLTETTTVGTQVSTTFATGVVDTTFVGAKNETTIAGVLGEITVCPVKASVEAVLIGSLEFSLCSIKRALTIGVGKEWKIGDVEEIGIPNKKKIALNELKLALSATRSTLRSQSTSLDSKNIAMTQSLTALQVYLGM